MRSASFDEIADLALDPDNSWSIGSFGAVGEFVRDADEATMIRREADALEIVTPRGGMRLLRRDDVMGVAWDTLMSDGETWGHALAFCVERPAASNGVVRSLGADVEALRAEDRGDRLFDLGVGFGAVSMALRTRDPALIEAMTAAEGQPLLTAAALPALVLKAQPHRVMLSPAGRIEVYQPIPPADGKSPQGPHTHLLPKLIAKGRPHSANAPIPDRLQAAVNVHPKSAWRSKLGERHPFDASSDDRFLALLDQFGLEEDRAIRRQVEDEVRRSRSPEDALEPGSRRGRAVARIALRRLSARGEAKADPWRVAFDRAPMELEEGEESLSVG